MTRFPMRCPRLPCRPGPRSRSVTGGRGGPPGRRARVGRNARAGRRARREPAGRPGRARVHGAGDTADRGAMIRIVIADDQALVRAGLTMLLGSAEDMEVVGEATNG